MIPEREDDPLFSAARKATEENAPAHLLARLRAIPSESRRGARAWFLPVSWGTVRIAAAACLVVTGVVWLRPGALHRTAPTEAVALDLLLERIARADSSSDLGLGDPVATEGGAGLHTASDPLPTLCSTGGCCVHSTSAFRRSPDVRVRRYDYGCVSSQNIVLLIVPARVAVTFGSARTWKEDVQNTPACVAEWGGAAAIRLRRGDDWWLLMGRATPEDLLRWIRSGLPKETLPPARPTLSGPCVGRQRTHA